MTTVREFSMAGPCLMRGTLLYATPNFYVYRNKWHGDERETRIAKTRAHVEPCSSCTDHARTQYPNGYID